jgi:hypothetical protein
MEVEIAQVILTRVTGKIVREPGIANRETALLRASLEPIP